MTSAAVVKRLKSFANPRRVPSLLWFFKTGPGGYGEGDEFLGLMVPQERQIAKEYRTLPFGEVAKLLTSRWHEARAVALMIMCLQFQRGDAATKDAIFRLYLRNLKYINNWDLIDASAGQIVGGHLLGKNEALLDRLSRSKQWYERRIAVVATQHFIRNRSFDCTIRLSRQLLRDEHDLLHKAVGWMLREVGNRDVKVLRRFLRQNAGRMPRTMLRYSIEKLPAAERKRWLACPSQHKRARVRSAI